MRRRWLLIAPLAVGIGLACVDRPPPVTRTPPVATVVVAASASAAPPKEAPRGASFEGEVLGLEYLADGTLAIGTPKEVVSVDGTGTVRHYALPKGKTAKLEPYFHGEGIVIEGEGDEALLLKSPGFEVLFTGAGTPLSRPGVGLTTKTLPVALVTPIGGALARFELPGKVKARVDAVALSASKRFAVVTYSVEDTDASDAAIFEVATKRFVGRAIQMPPSYGMPAVAAFDPTRDVQYGVEKGSVLAIDLTTAKVRKAKLACPANVTIGNPMPMPDAEQLLVTCGMDGLLLDTKTFAVKRRYSRIMPGCDNGDTLTAHYDPKKKTDLLLEGCGGYARMDLTTGRYRCADDKGLLGAPYEMGLGSRGYRLPADRANVPRCTSAEEAEAAASHTGLGTSGNYKMLMTDAQDTVVVGPSGKIILDPGAPPPVMAGDESKMAYALKDRVVIRALPDGKPLLELYRH